MKGKIQFSQLSLLQGLSTGELARNPGFARSRPEDMLPGFIHPWQQISGPGGRGRFKGKLLKENRIAVLVFPSRTLGTAKRLRNRSSYKHEKFNSTYLHLRSIPGWLETPMVDNCKNVKRFCVTQETWSNLGSSRNSTGCVIVKRICIHIGGATKWKLTTEVSSLSYMGACNSS